MNFTDVQGTWKQIKAYIDTKISSSNDGVPIGGIIIKNPNITEDYLGDNYAKCDGSNIETDCQYLADVGITDDTSNSKMPTTNKLFEYNSDYVTTEGKLIDNILYSRSGVIDLKAGKRILDKPVSIYPFQVSDKCVIETYSYNKFTIYELDGSSKSVTIPQLKDGNNIHNTCGLLRIQNRYYCFTYPGSADTAIFVTNDFVNFTKLTNYLGSNSAMKFGAMYANDGCIYFSDGQLNLHRINVDGTITKLGYFDMNMTSSRGSCLVHNNIFYVVYLNKYIYYYDMSTNKYGYYDYNTTNTQPSSDGLLRIVKFNNKEYLCCYDRVLDDTFKVGKSLVWYNGYIYYTYGGSLYKCKDCVKITPVLSKTAGNIQFFIKIK